MYTLHFITLSQTSLQCTIKTEDRVETNFNGCSNFSCFLINLSPSFLLLNSVFNNDLFVLCILSPAQTLIKMHFNDCKLNYRSTGIVHTSAKDVLSVPPSGELV